VLCNMRSGYALRTFGLRVPFQDAHSVIQFLNKVQLVNRNLQFSRHDDCLIIPLNRQLSDAELSELESRSVQARVCEEVFSTSPKRPRDLREACLKLLPSNIVERLPRSYDIIGEIALVEIEDELKAFSSIIGNGILRIHPHLRLVVEKVAKTEGQLRIRKVKPIAGHGKTETVHREFSCKFSLDVDCVYFNPRLSHERMRIAKQVKGGEVVVDMFAGVGPYSILMAKTQPIVQVFSIDLNPAAYKYLAENIFLNKVVERVSCHLGDARKYASTSLRGIADRVVMNLPSNSSEYLDTASSFLKPNGGIIHYYAFAQRNQNIEDVASIFQSLLKASGRRVETIKYQRVIKEVGPNRVQIVLDAIIR